jgi:hypothetical protein
MSTRNLVGIGNTDPQFTLDVEGDINVSGGLFTNGSNASGALYWSETEAENIVTGANVGIGVTGEPSDKLHVVGNLNLSTGSTFKINGTDVLSGSGLGTGVTGSSLTSVGTLSSLLVSGNVGVGTNNAVEKLHVLGNARIDGNLTLHGTQTIINTQVEQTTRLEITNSGTGPAVIVNQTGPQPIANFQDDGVSALFIADGGNIGVGNTTPIAKLEVTGSVKAGGTTSAQTAVLLAQDITGFGVIQGVQGDNMSVSNDLYIQPYGGKPILPSMWISSSLRHYTFHQVWHQTAGGVTTNDMMLATTIDAANITRRSVMPFNVSIDRCVITTDNDAAAANTYRIDFFKPSLTTSNAAGNLYPTVFASRTLEALPAVMETAGVFTFAPVDYFFGDGISIRVVLLSGNSAIEFMLSLYGYQV